MHERQQELYIVSEGESKSSSATRPGTRSVRAEWPASMQPTKRKIRNTGEGDAVYIVVGAEGGYVGRDGLLPEGEQRIAPLARLTVAGDGSHRLPDLRDRRAARVRPHHRRRPGRGRRVRQIAEGMVLVSAMHITAGVWINDDEPGIQADALEWLDKIAPPSWKEPANDVARRALTRPRRLPPPPRRRGQRRRPPEEPARPPPGDRAGDRGQARPRPLAGDLLRRVRRPPPEAAGDQGPEPAATPLSRPSRTAGTA